MKDVVCGMEVVQSTKFKSVYKNKQYLFCSIKCKEAFDRSPDTYVK
ncbi:MAG: YHS domain-containing protein [Candidatus Micrarchaeaceae archaeon]